ncbi:MAG TPA: hypothetical protein PKO07_07865 [Pseudomonadota bacterium]|nr:hypothetical protein [Pseudomonadota bacterium]HNI58609.1 hypothetical protein [Pseudomonadota bacterium]HNN50924.1 hypothetical protein [Pseudomonadota bacterium]
MWSDRRGTAKASSGPHRRWLVAALVLGGLVTDVSCGPQIPSGQPLTEGDLAVAPIDWNVAPLAAGKVVAIAENDDDVALFSDGSVSVWSGGESLGRDSSVRAWRSAAAVPALGFSGRWLLGVSDDGKLYRLHYGEAQTLSCEDVSARYLLSNSPVREVAALGGALVGFVTDGRLAISDGQRLKQYELSLHGLTGSLGKAAGITDDEVVVLFAQDDTLQRLSLPSVNWVAFDGAGMLWAASGSGLYRQRDDHFEQVLSPADGQSIRGLSAGSAGLWLLMSDGVALVRDGQLLRAPLPTVGNPGDDAAAMLRVLGSPSGDAWLLTDSQVVRVGEESGGGQDLVLWRKQMQPVFVRTCQGCHLPSGSAHLDLSTHSSWARYRRVLAQRVVAGTPTPMPPTGAGKLTADELAQVMAWTSRP